jgi:hypothetical protein
MHGVFNTQPRVNSRREEEEEEEEEEELTCILLYRLSFG